MAYRMQTSVPETMSIDDEPAHIHEMYGTRSGKESFANNCLLARRLAKNGLRFIQLYDWGWDSHGASKDEATNEGFKGKCDSIDKPIAALLTGLEQRGMLEDTLVVWGGEFGSTPMQENRGGATNTFVVRDLHATMLQLFGFDAKCLSCNFQGFDQKLIGVKPAKVINDFLV